MDAHSCASGEFAPRPGTLRTLRYYDRIGLLTPASRSEAGYRRYCEDDLEDLEQILALKYPGSSVDEIRRLAEHDVSSREARLAKQKAMVRDKRAQPDDNLRAIERAGEAQRTEDPGSETLAKIIEAIQMEQKDDWVEKYVTDEQRATMDRLSEGSYSRPAPISARRGGHSWSPNEHSTQQSPAVGRSSAPQHSHSWKNTHASTGVGTAQVSSQVGQVIGVVMGSKGSGCEGRESIMAAES